MVVHGMNSESKQTPNELPQNGGSLFFKNICQTRVDVVHHHNDISGILVHLGELANGEETIPEGLEMAVFNETGIQLLGGGQNPFNEFNNVVTIYQLVDALPIEAVANHTQQFDGDAGGILLDHLNELMNALSGEVIVLVVAELV